MKITQGFSDTERSQVAKLYWSAFGVKLGRVMGPDQRALGFIEDVLDPTHAICARDEHGSLIGVAGFKTHKGALDRHDAPLWLDRRGVARRFLGLA